MAKKKHKAAPKREEHVFVMWRWGYPICCKCGMLWLKNKASDEWAKQECK